MLVKGGKIKALRLEHCWVEVYIAYLPYLGAKDWNKGRKMWVGIDPSFKQYVYPEEGTYTDPETNQTIEKKNIDISKKLPFDIDKYLSKTQSLPPFMKYLEDVGNWLIENTPEGVVYNIFSTRVILPELIEVLPGLSNKVLSINAKYSIIPDSLRHKVRFGGNVDYEISTIQLVSKRITLSYCPASSSDQEIINSYGTLYNVPAYLVEVRPQLKIGGEIKSTGEAIKLGAYEKFTIEFIEPGGFGEVVTNDVIAGEYYGIGVGSIPGELIKLSSDRFGNAYDIESLYVNGLLNDNVAGESLYFSAINWLYLTQANYSLIKTIMGIVSRRQAMAMAFFKAEVDYVFNVPRGVDIKGIGIDVDKDTAVAFASSGDVTQVKDFMELRGCSGSVMEHSVLDIPLGITTAISGAKAIQIANLQGIPIHKINGSNASSILPLLQVSPEIKVDIRNAINAGLEVTVPESNIQYGGWEGVGYIVTDPLTGSSAYRISGGADGAVVLIPEGAHIYASGLERFVRNKALIAIGDPWVRMEEEEMKKYEWPTLLSPKFLYFESAFVATGALFRLGYNPFCKRIYTKDEYLSEISDEDYLILYHVGHGGVDKKTGELGLSLLPPSLGSEYVMAKDIRGVSTGHFKFVFIDACYGANEGGVCGAFKSDATLGCKGRADGVYMWWFGILFWLECINQNEYVKAAAVKATTRADRIRRRVAWMIVFFGDELIRLRKED
jgi:hypothetical protein